MSAFTTAAPSNRTSRKRPLSNGAVESTAVKRRLGRPAAAVGTPLHMSTKYDTMLACSVLDKFQDASRLKRNHNAESLIQHDTKLPMAYNNSVKKGMSKTIKEIQESKCAKFFGVELDVSISEIPNMINPVETIVYVDWKRSGNVFNFDAKQLSTSAWRHFRLSWHDYMNMVILASPLRRDRLILEKVKNLGPPRSINALRQTFALGDSRSRRIFFQIYYAPRIAEKNDISLPSTLRIIEKQSDYRQIIHGINVTQPFYPIATTPFRWESNYTIPHRPYHHLMINVPVVDLTSVNDMVNIVEPDTVLPPSCQDFASNRGRVIGSKKCSAKEVH